MIFINVSPLLWDLIVVMILVFGLVTGLFIGGRALLFISCGNLLAIILMLAFKSLLMGYFKSWMLVLFSNLDPNFMPFRELLVDNVGFIIYVIVWVVGVNILFWIMYLILRFTVLTKYKVEHRGINATLGAIVNFVRMSVVGWLLIVMMSTSVFGNKYSAFGLTKNEIPENSFTYKFFGSIDNNIPFLKIANNDINIIIDIYQNHIAVESTHTALINATNYEQCFSIITDLRKVLILSINESTIIDQALDNIKNGAVVNLNKVIIFNTLNEHSINKFLSINSMEPLLLALQHIINLYPETAQAFIDNLKDVPSINTINLKYKPRYDQLKPLLVNFINATNNLDAKAKLITLLERIYKPF